MQMLGQEEGNRLRVGRQVTGGRVRGLQVRAETREAAGQDRRQEDELPLHYSGAVAVMYRQIGALDGYGAVRVEHASWAAV